MYSALYMFTFGVDVASHLEGLGGSHVRVGGRHGQDDGVGVGDVLQDEVSDLELDVVGLVAHGDLRKQRAFRTPCGRDTLCDLLSDDGLVLFRTFVSPGRSTNVRFTT